MLHCSSSIVLLITLLLGPVASEVPRLGDPVPEPWRWKVFNRLNGSGPLCLTESPDGTMWFGTAVGVYSYDGYTWQHYTTEDGLLNNKVTSIGADPQGRVYAGGPAGVAESSGKGWRTVLGPGNKDIPWNVYDIMFSSDGAAWFATAWGAFRVDAHSNVLWTSPAMTEAVKALSQVEVMTLPEEAIPQSSWTHGLGIQIVGGINPPTPVVWNVHPASKAALAGVKVGDRVLEVDHSLEVTQSRLDGVPGSRARLLIRSRLDSTREVVLNRQSRDDFSVPRTPVGGFPVYDILEDRDGSIWFSVSDDHIGGVVVRCSPSLQDCRKYPADVSPGNRPRLIQRKTGEIVVSSFEPLLGVDVYRDASWQTSYLYRDVHPDEGHGVLAESKTLRDTTHTNHEILKSIAMNPSLIETEDGVLWVGGESTLITRASDNWHHYTNERIPIPPERINSMLEDTRGGVWLLGRGLPPARISYGDKRWTSYPELGYRDATQNAHWFISNDESVWVEDQGEWRRYTVKEGMIDKPDFLHVGSAATWVAGIQDSVAATARLSGTRWVKERHPEFSANVSAFLETSGGNVWLGGSVDNASSVAPFLPGGAKALIDGRWHRFHPVSEAPAFVYGIAETFDGKVWMGGSSVRQYDDGHWVVPDLPENLIPSDLNKTDVVYVDPSGALWLGSRVFGLYRYQSGAWSRFTTEDGLSGNQIRSVVGTRAGGVMVSTDQGISRFDGDSWITHVLPRSLSPTSSRYGLNESPDGTLWINLSDGGVVGYRPDLDPPITTVTTPDGQEFVADLVSISWTGVDKWDDTEPEELAYSWRLDQGPWSPFGKLASVELTDVSPGQHRLFVRARDKDYNIEPNPSTIMFVVVSPIYTRPWFVVLCAIAIVTIVAQSVRLVQRRHALLASNHQLGTQAAELQRQIRERESAEAERARLDVQLAQLRYLDRLRSSLGRTKAPVEAAQQVGAVLMEVLAETRPASVIVAIESAIWSFGEPFEVCPCRYERPIQWGDRVRGTLSIACSIDLSESQERALLDETAAQLSRVLEAQELSMQLLQSARLVSMGQMAAGVAHELNQPLGGISATAEDFYLRLQDGLAVGPDQWSDMLKRVLGMVDRMSETVNHLRVFSRDESQEPGIVYEINKVVDETLGIIGTQLQNHGIILSLQLSDDLPELNGHPRQIEQVILNLLGNARDSVDAQAEAVSSGYEKRITISTERSDGHIVVEVTDNGGGIDSENVGRVFEPFFTTKTEDKGTGLGLSISYAIVKNHQGDIVVESKPGEGATFRLSLPLTS